MKILNQIYYSLTKTERYVFWGAILIFLTSGIIWANLMLEAATVEIPVSSNKYREGIVGQPVNVNPIFGGLNDADRDLIELLFSDLITLSESHKASGDGQTWNVILKSNLHWSDGRPLTSDDVIFTIDTIQSASSQSPLFMTWQGVVADRISEREIEFTLRSPYAFFLNNLKDLKIIPKHIFSVIPAENFHLSGFNLEPVGSGPYKFASSEKRKNGFITSYHLATNEYSPLEKPLIKEFEVKFYQDSAEIIRAFNTKKIDGFGGINPKNIEDLKLNHKIIGKLIPQYYAIFINKNTGNGLNNDNVLSALNLATNKERIIETVFSGKALTVNQPLLPFISGYDQSADPGNEFSLEEANEILEKDKWMMDEKIGTRSKTAGNRTEILEFSIVVPQIPFLTETVEIIKSDWEQIGVKLNPIVLNPSDVANEVIKTRNYQMIIFGNVLKNNPDIFSFWHSSERFYPGLNLALYENKKVDNLLESIRKNLNAEVRKNELAELQKLIIEDQPAIFLYSPIYLYAGPKDFGGFEEVTISVPSDRFRNVHKWYLETEKVFE
jgi:peptide/nickel transport system substrate-binding protein